jgi:hypothetical protein
MGELRLAVALAAIVGTLLLCAPALVALSRRTFRLMHPAVIFPVYLTYQSLIPAASAVVGESMKVSTQAFLGDPWFLVRALAIQWMAFAAFLAGVRVAGTPIVPARADLWDLDHPELPIFRGATPVTVLVTGLALLAAATAIKVVELQHYGGGVLEALLDVRGFIFGSGYGHYWMHVAFTSAFLIPAVLFVARRGHGLIALVVAAPITLLSMSKAGIIRIATAVLTYSQTRVFRGAAGPWIAAVVGAVVMLTVPRAVAVIANAPGESVSPARAVATLLHREYSFEMFAVIVASADDIGIEHTGGAWLRDELSQFVPRAVWPEKPLSRALEIGPLYMPLDFSARLPMFVAPHLFGLLFAEGGVPAVLGGSALLGWLLGLSYGRAQRMSRARFDRLPLLCYLCAVASLKGLVDGGVANYLMQTVFGVGMMLTWALLASAVPTLARARR